MLSSERSPCFFYFSLKRIMETKETNLYKVYAKGWNAPAYVTAENQQEAVDKVAPYYETENPAYMNVEYVSHVSV